MGLAIHNFDSASYCRRDGANIKRDAQNKRNEVQKLRAKVESLSTERLNIEGQIKTLEDDGGKLYFFSVHKDI